MLKKLPSTKLWQREARYYVCIYFPFVFIFLLYIFFQARGGEREVLTEETGIDILGNMLEASDLSINKKLYGELHNFGHLAIAYCHDPDSRYLVSIETVF